MTIPPAPTAKTPIPTKRTPLYAQLYTQVLAAIILVAGAVAGAVNGIVLIVSRVPDVVVTLSAGFIWGGVALLILEQPGGGAPEAFLNFAGGTDIAYTFVKVIG